MSNKKRLPKKLGHIIATIATKSAVIEANTACPFLHYQPKEPQEVKALRKF